MSMTMQKHTITAFYDSRDYANSAATKLKQFGVPASDVIVSPENARDELGVRSGQNSYAEPKRTGFWASLEEMFGDTEDQHTYTEGVRRGGTLLTAHVTDAQLDQAIVIVDEHGSIDLDEREETWRSEGWTGASAGGRMAATGVAGVGATSLAMASTAPVTKVVTTETVAESAPVLPSAPLAKAPVPAVAKAVAPPVGTAERSSDDVVQVVEESLNVGKRAVSRGNVRLHSYVVEKQVSEDVRLRDETVSIDRHAVDRPVAALGADAFEERTIEMEEIDEEAVVAKSARVVEEIGIRKDVADRTETIRDTVRSTKVDIEDSRTVGATKSGLLGDFGARLAKDMEVVGSDGQHVGVIDHVDGDTIKLKKMDPASSGLHHLIMVSSVASVGAKVVLKTTAKDAMARWTAAN